MRNIIGGDHIIDKNHWTLTIIRRGGQEKRELVATGHHSFLVLEGVNDIGERVAMEAHLGYRNLNNGFHDDTKAQIYYFLCPLAKLQNLSSDKYIKKTWAITLEEKDQIEKRIWHDKQFSEKNDCPYVYVGKTKTSGFFGGSLDKLGSPSSKKASIERN